MMGAWEFKTQKSSRSPDKCRPEMGIKSLLTCRYRGKGLGDLSARRKTYPAKTKVMGHLSRRE